MLNALRTLANRFSRNVPATQLQLKAVNSFLSTYCPDRQERLLLLGQLFERELASSKQLTIGEASAFIELAYADHTNWVHDPEFVTFIEQEKQQLYAF